MHFVWGDSPGTEYARQVPREVQIEAAQKYNDSASDANEASAQISAVFDYSNSCEKDGYYEYQVHDDEIVIDSYKEVEKNGICLQRYSGGVTVDFEIKGLQEGQIYHVYFLDEDGDPRYVGNLSTGEIELSQPRMY
jgi:hypothetical protein